MASMAVSAMTRLSSSGAVLLAHNPFSPPRRKAREVAVFDFVAAQAVPVEVRENGVSPRVDADTAVKAGIGQHVGRYAALLLQIAVMAVYGVHGRVTGAHLDEILGRRFKLGQEKIVRRRAATGQGARRSAMAAVPCAPRPGLPPLRFWTKSTMEPLSLSFPMEKYIQCRSASRAMMILSPFWLAHDGAVAAGSFAVEAVAARGGILRQIDPGFEGFQFVDAPGHASLSSSQLRQFDTVLLFLPPTIYDRSV